MNAMRIRSPSAPWLVLALLGVGILLWFAVLWAGYNGSMPVRALSTLQLKALGLALVALLIPPVRRSMFAAMQGVRRPSRRAKRWTALAVALLTGTYLLGTSLYQGRDLFPKLHDEQMHL